MHRLLPVAGLAVLLIVFGSPAALAAGGPTSASIDGPGIEGGIDIGQGDAGFGELAVHAGLFAVRFPEYRGDNVSQLAEQRPYGDLGPEYRIAWTVPNSADTADTFVQRLYPYAEAGPVTHTEKGQAYTMIEGRLIGRTQLGGWHVGGAELRAALTEIGVPGHPPATGPNATPIAFGVAALFALGLLTLWIRRSVWARQHAVA